MSIYSEPVSFLFLDEQVTDKIYSSIHVKFLLECIGMQHYRPA